ncbi:MAG: hypothetical protein BGP22_24170 [Variovorax sp. 67-131]|jgi:hypothetical protein|nr:MAG: hypothetical protein ABS94_26740 [Variovorax sp. SCN 67-85]ODV23028.1 MAG: hypothetical protein ABT25_20005 [Variovorax sp. SCN 67-20]OJZ12959.1 MAG: hypothetical protein BGP22_24170 [Variovorax sp. 67-131]
MKLLRIADNHGYFLAADGSYVAVDRITKEDLLRLVGSVIDEEAAELDEFDGEAIKNQAHKVIYKSVAMKLADLRKRRTQFIDEAARLFLEEYESYRT